MKLSYAMLTASIPFIDTLHVSDAGKFGEQTQTPKVDEAVLTTSFRSPLSKKAILNTGSISPAVIVSALLKELSVNPVIIDLDETVTTSYTRDNLAGVGHVYAPKFPPLQKVENELEVTCNHDKIVNELTLLMMESDQLIIAECVPGGTLTASLVSSILSYEYIQYKGSSTDAMVNLTRMRVLKQSYRDVKKKLKENDSFYKGNKLEKYLKYCDLFQITLVCILLELAQKAKEHSCKIVLGGGCQMQAVMHLANDYYCPSEMKRINSVVSIATTPWVQNPNNYLTLKRPLQWDVINATTFLMTSKFKAVRSYEKGLTVEGCGMGAVLKFCEDINMTNEQIVECIDYYIQVQNKYNETNIE